MGHVVTNKKIKKQIRPPQNKDSKKSLHQRSSEKNTSPIEISVGLILTGLLVYLHVVFFLHAGALWRDETNSVGIATLPSIKDIWENIEYDSFPILWHLTMRMWFALGMGGSDLNIRLLGLLSGIGIIVVLWLNARKFNCRIPLIALALIGFNAAVISAGDSIRAYGLGMLSGLMTIGVIWQTAVKGRRKDWVIALIVSLIAVHMLFYNAVVLLTACTAGAVVCWRMRLWKRMMGILGIGVIAAISLLSYLASIESAKRWNMIVHYPVDLDRLWLKIQESLVSTALWMPELWICVAIVAVIVAFIMVVRKTAALDEKQRQVVLFAGTLLVFGTTAYLVFLKVLSYFMQPWYFVVLIAMAGTGIDTIFATALQGRRRCWLRIIFALAIALLVFANVRQKVVERKTNVDVIAETIEKEARPGDAIVLGRWYYGIPFQRYYHGKAQWITIPPVDDHRFHRYDQLQKQMRSGDVMMPVLSLIERSLKSGNKVWIVGDMMLLPRQGEFLPMEAQHPDKNGIWAETPYYALWSKQMWSFLMSHAKENREETPKIHDPVNSDECLRVYILNGWQN
jgi:hypothetical protein